MTDEFYCGRCRDSRPRLGAKAVSIGGAEVTWCASCAADTISSDELLDLHFQLNRMDMTTFAEFTRNS